METRPKEKRLQIASFITQATRGVVRDQNTRRWTMFIVVLIALAMLFCGSTILRDVLNPHEHPGWFIFFWFVCAWLTLLVLLLALFDLLMLRAQGRAARKAVREELAAARERESHKS